MEGEPRRVRAVLRVEIDLDGVFASREAFEAAAEEMWRTDGYLTAGRLLGLDVEEHWVELLFVDDGDEDEDPEVVAEQRDIEREARELYAATGDERLRMLL